MNLQNDNMMQSELERMMHEMQGGSKKSLCLLVLNTLPNNKFKSQSNRVKCWSFGLQNTHPSSQECSKHNRLLMATKVNSSSIVTTGIAT